MSTPMLGWHSVQDKKLMPELGASEGCYTHLKPSLLPRMVQSKPFQCNHQGFLL